MVDKAFKLGFIIGRFQHLTIGHKRMIDAGLSSCWKVLLLVGSSQEAFTERNPFTLKTRMDVIRAVYKQEIEDGRLLLGHIDDLTNENDVSVEWGKFVIKRVDMWRQHYGLSTGVDCMVYGNDEDRMNWYDPEHVQGISQILIARPEHAISATKVRSFLKNDLKHEWKRSVPNEIQDSYWFETLRGELMQTPYYKEIEGND